MALLDTFIVNVAFPAIAHRFTESNTSRLSWVLNGYAIVYAALIVPAGQWADRAGRKRAFLFGIALFTVASALCAASVSVWMLIGSRILQATGASLLSPSAMGLMLAEFPAERRSTAVALFAAVGGVAAALGAPAGGLLAQISWHWVFLVNLPIGLITFLIGIRVLRETREEVSGVLIDLLGAVFLMGGVGCLILAIIKGSEWGWTSTRMAVCAMAAVTQLVWFFRRSSWHPSPVIELPLMRARSFAAANLSAFLFASAFSAMILSNVLFVTRVWHLKFWQVGLELSPGPLMAAATALPAGRLCVRWSPRTVALASAGFVAAGCAWLGWQLGPFPHYAKEFLPGGILVGIGIGLNLPSVSSAAFASLPLTRFSTGAAILNMSRQIGTALGTAVLVAIVGDKLAPGNLMPFRTAYAAIGVAAIGSGTAAIFFKPTSPKR
jgi:EmrB/QacA subfamily drug resistance transporter